jgi:hypothetical protein
MPTNLTDLLATDLDNWLKQTPDGLARRVLLWLDPDSSFRRLVGGSSAELTSRGIRLLSYDPSAGFGQLALKLALLKTEADSAVRVAVYLPGFGGVDLEPRADGSPPALWSVYEYRYKGCVWGKGARWEPGEVPEPLRLVGWLRGHGVQLAAGAEAALTTEGADSLLSRYAERQAQSDPVDWPRPLRVDDVREALAGDPRDELRSLLVAPHNATKRWGEDQALVIGRLNQEFGLGLAANAGSSLDPEELANSAVVGIALADAWLSFGRPADFPFLSRLAATREQCERLARFLRDDVLPHVELRPRFRARMARSEPTYDLRDWATGRAGEPGGLPRLARSRWEDFLARLRTAESESWRAAREVLLAQRAALEAAAEGPWALGSDRSGDEPIPWRIAADLAALAAEAERATGELSFQAGTAELVQSYAERWWKIDARYLAVRAGCSGRGGLEILGVLADAAYCAWVFRASDRFAELVEANPAWPPGGTVGVADLSTALWSTPNGNRRRGIIISDAVRWDLGEAVRRRLADPTTLDPVLATLPSETPFGMPALLPLNGAQPSIDFGSGWPRIRFGDGPDVATREGRKAFLTAALAGPGKPKLEFVDLTDLFRTQKVPSAPIVVVLDNAIDQQGHSNAAGLMAQVPAFVADLARAIQLLHDAGIGEVHLVTDHGFLLLPTDAVDALGHPPLLPAHALRKDFRWAALKPDAPVSDVLRLPLPLAPTAITIGLPWGARTFTAAEPYLHGGLSLQECVIPHLVSQRAFARARVGVDLQVKNPVLTGGTVIVVLRPHLPAGQGTLGGVEPTHVRLSIETDASDGSAPRSIMGPFDVELRPDVEALRPPVYLPEGANLKAGQKLRLRAIERDTGRDLGSLGLTLGVDWE